MKLKVNNVDPSTSGLLNISGTLLGWAVVMDLESISFQFSERHLISIQD